ncbi:MAG: hypothetical protein VKP72_09415 [bacterium]|nr:hypothetical protein [bacterium]
MGARFTSGERGRVEQALSRTGKNLSDFIRDAVLSAADSALLNDAVSVFGVAIGAIDVPGDHARRADELLSGMLIDKHAARSRRTRGSSGGAGLAPDTRDGTACDPGLAP